MSSKAPKKTFSDLKAAAQKGLANIDVDALKDKAAGKKLANSKMRQSM